jgi:MFS family permease
MAIHSGDPRRWAILATFAVGSAFSAFSWLCFAPISSLVESTYSTTPLGVNLLSLSFMIVYLPASIFSVWLMDMYGLRATLIVGAFSNAAMNWVKFTGAYIGGPTGFTIILAGQCIGAVGQPLILNIPARLSMDWFTQSERDIATVAATMANILGQMAGSLLPALLVTGEDDFRALMLYQALPCTVALIIAVIVARDRPTLPASAAAAHQWAEQAKLKSESLDSPSARVLKAMWHDSVALTTHANFVWLCAGFTLATGSAWSLLTLQAQIIQPCGYGNSIVGTSGAALLGVGVLASFAIGVWLQRSTAYVITQKLLVIACAAATVGILGVNRPGNAGPIVAMWCLLGAAIQPLMPVSLEHAAEMTYPVSADSSSTVLLVAANVFGCILTLILTVLLAQPSFSNCSSVVNPASGVILTVMLGAAVVTLPVRKEYRRHDAEALLPLQQGFSEDTHALALPLLVERVLPLSVVSAPVRATSFAQQKACAHAVN